VIFADQFSTDSLASSWEAIAGDWSIAAGVLSIEDAAALLLADAVHPDGAGAPHVVRVKVRFGTAGDVARVVLAYTDASNYLFAELWTSSGGCPHLRLWERVGGSDNAVTAELTPAVDMPLDAWHTLTLCFKPGESMIDPVQFGAILQTSTGNTIYASNESNPSSPGDRAGVATGATVAGTIDFDDFQFLHHKGTESHQNCPECQQATNDCLLHSDGFGRSDGDDLGCGWEELAGDADIDTGRLVTSSAGAVIRNRTRHPDDSAKVQIVVTFEAAAGGIPIVILDYEDDDNFFFVKLEPGSHGDCGRLSFWRRTAGTDAQLGTDSVIAGMSAGAEHTLTLCWLGNLIHANVTVAAGDYAGGSHSVNGEAQAAAEPYTGLGTAADSSGALAFDSWALRRTRDDDHAECPDCGNAECVLYCGDPRASMIGETPLALNCLWNNVSGDWDIGVSPDVVFTAICGSLEPIVVSEAEAILINETGHPGLTAEGHLDLTSAAAVQVSTVHYSNIARILLGVQDDENYLFAEWEWAASFGGAGELRIGKVVAGAETIIDTQASNTGGAGDPQVAGFDPSFVDFPSELRICYDGYELMASFQNGAFSAVDVQTEITYARGVAGTGWNPGKSGLGTGATTTGDIHFANFRFYHDIYSGNPSCPPCTFVPACPFCGDYIDSDCVDRTPPIMLVKIEGITPDGSLEPGWEDLVCYAAGQFNDTFALPYLSHVTGTCTWQAKVGFCGGVNPFAGGGDLRARVQFQLTRINTGSTATAALRLLASATGYGDVANPYSTSAPNGKLTTIQTLTNGNDHLFSGMDPGLIYNRDCTGDPITFGSQYGLDCLAFLTDWVDLGPIWHDNIFPTYLRQAFQAEVEFVSGPIGPVPVWLSTCHVKALI
jgi:hypothetical protein